MRLPVLSIDQPYASLVMAGVKTWETRTGPPNGDMRPAGVRGIPGLRINRGDRIGIASTRRIPGLRRGQSIEVGRFTVENDTPRKSDPQYLMRGLAWPYRLPAGCLLGTVRVVDAYPIVDGRKPYSYPGPVIALLADRLLLIEPGSNPEEGEVTDISDQIPYGDWRPGRWALLLADPAPTTERCPACDGIAPGCWICPVCDGSRSCPPIPATGKQGVWTWNGEVRT